MVSNWRVASHQGIFHFWQHYSILKSRNTPVSLFNTFKNVWIHWRRVVWVWEDRLCDHSIDLFVRPTYISQTRAPGEFLLWSMVDHLAIYLTQHATWVVRMNKTSNLQTDDFYQKQNRWQLFHVWKSCCLHSSEKGKCNSLVSTFDVAICQWPMATTFWFWLPE